MSATRNLNVLAFTLLTVLLLNGCSSGDLKLGSVSGTVTLDDQPLAGAVVEFQPATGSPSEAVTDSSGKYTLKYTARKPGALLGNHRVYISRSTKTGADGQEVDVPETLPPRYNLHSELTADVRSGSNKVDFTLQSR
jgi:hypothetical protein